MEFEPKRQFKEGWRVAKTVDRLTSLYKERCPALELQLKVNGVSYEKWDEFSYIGLNPNKLAYALAGFAYFILHDGVSRVDPQ